MEKTGFESWLFHWFVFLDKTSIFHSVCLRPRGEMGSGNLTKCKEGAREEWVGLGHVRWVTMLLSAPLSIQD